MMLLLMYVYILLMPSQVSQMQSTLSELGSMFERFGSIVSEQGEMIQRIDTNADGSQANVGEAHTQIQKYQRSIAANRGLIIKTFVVLWAFILVYGFVSR